MPGELDYQICPSCGGEFTLAVTRCAECDVDLVPPGSDEDEFPPASELACVRVAPVPWIQALSEALEQREVIHRVEPVAPDDAPDAARAFGKVELFGLYVDDAGLDLARDLDRQIAAQALPEQQADPLAEDEVETCPACGEPLAADATECPACGLAFA